MRVAYAEIAIPNVQARDNMSDANNHRNQKKKTIQKRRLALSTAVESPQRISNAVP